MDDTINRARELIAQRDKIDAELASLFNGTSTKEKRVVKCGTCGQEGHNSKTCSQKPQE